MSRGYNTNKRRTRNSFSQAFVYQNKKVPFMRGGRRVF